jgi:hypothetical protein
MQDSSESSSGTCADDPHHSEDSLIRWAGFVIAARPEGCQARWRRGRLFYLHEQALTLAKKAWHAELERLETKHGREGGRR